ncbi:MAG: hypothetical protein KME60_18870 [Cyanomargarita calcarea GSE-NOS-MK-12-04C]|jgi:hypothetical protein|uniref:Uncharacterized protein n=1 Tax=Cyanomargarita calcarea GSE-NOS-MK-12-04C TaxID=2839659 RepID=A0A951UTW5_9CYAN|nr:hypothetical protein [Cyanomargarita calcarea GSE-NOS-MK-12-04C]
MAKIKINELQPIALLEKVSDADLKAVNGGDGLSFQLVVGGTSATTGAAAGGRVFNGTNSQFFLNGGLPDTATFSVQVFASAFSQSSPF